MGMRKPILSCMVVVLLVAAGSTGQTMNGLDSGRAEVMLQQVYTEVEKHYYDETFHGVDLKARYEDYTKRVSRAHTIPEAFRLIAAFLAGLNDSHTFFVPPPIVGREDYGYVLEMIGDRSFVTYVRPGSDASKNLHPGDEVLALNGYAVNRPDISQLWYTLNELQPVSVTKLKRRSPNGSVDDISVKATLTTGKVLRDYTLRMGDDDIISGELVAERRIHDLRQRYVEIGDSMIWKMPAFLSQQNDLRHLIGLARRHKALILDLRGNTGGTSDVLEELVGSVIDREVQIAERSGRHPMKPLKASRTGSVFDGDLIVLVDSRTASAAEVFARTMQLNHRATVIGDRTAGGVMEAIHVPLQQGTNIMLLQYGVSITTADLVMPDGRSLEHSGVTPDEMVLPNAEDLAAERDPVLSYAAQKLGVKLDPAAAGALFPFEWTPLGK